MSTVPSGQDKQAVRFLIREKLQQLSLAEQQSQSEIIMHKIEQCEEFRTARSVLCYWPICNEVNLVALIEKYATQKTVLLPGISGNDLVLKRFVNKEQMRLGELGIREPVGEAFTGGVDVALVPGIAFTRAGCRLGRGGGYYDRFLTSEPVFKIGVAFGVQVLDALPFDEWDVEMDRLIVG